MPESPDFDLPDEALYRSYDTWQLEQLRRSFAAAREADRVLPVEYYDSRLAHIDRLLAARGAAGKPDA